MLRTRVIPVVLLDSYSVLKTINFDVRRGLGNPITVAKIYNTRNVDELILLDIDATKQGRSIDLVTVEEVANECFMPLSVGGGLKTIEDIRSVLMRGADKAILNSITLKNPQIVQEASKVFGSQCIVVSIDVKRIDENYVVFSDGKSTNIDPLVHASKLIELGAGEVFFNSVDFDGVMGGVDLDFIELVRKKLKSKVPLIYAGGVKTPDDFIPPIKAGFSAVAASSIFHFTRYTPEDCKKALVREGIPARLFR